MYLSLDIPGANGTHRTLGKIEIVFSDTLGLIEEHKKFLCFNLKKSAVFHLYCYCYIYKNLTCKLERIGFVTHLHFRYVIYHFISLIKNKRMH